MRPSLPLAPGHVAPAGHRPPSEVSFPPSHHSGPMGALGPSDRMWDRRRLTGNLAGEPVGPASLPLPRTHPTTCPGWVNSGACEGVKPNGAQTAGRRAGGSSRGKDRWGLRVKINVSEGQSWHREPHEQAEKLTSILAAPGGEPMSGGPCRPQWAGPQPVSLVTGAETQV